MLNTVIISNGIRGGIGELAVTGNGTAPRVVETGADFHLDLDDADLFIVPNGSDHMALMREREAIARFLGKGGALFCFDGWVTPWVPFNEWVMDNSKRSAEVRYHIKDDPYGLMEGISLDDLIFRHGISGWWACGHIEPARGATVVLEDSWGRAVLVVDDASTPGLMVLTASGPVGDWGDETPTARAVSRLYLNMLRLGEERRARTCRPSH